MNPIVTGNAAQLREELDRLLIELQTCRMHVHAQKPEQAVQLITHVMSKVSTLRTRCVAPPAARAQIGYNEENLTLGGVPDAIR